MRESCLIGLTFGGVFSASFWFAAIFSCGAAEGFDTADERDAKPLILLTNDDGVKGPGLIALREELSAFADVVVVAPSKNRSGASQSLRISGSFAVRVEQEGSVYAVDAPPATCVHFALRSLLADRPVALVVSGINHGQNLGRDISSSGTVGAARMAAETGVPAIAFSISHGSREFGAAASFASRFVKELLRRRIDSSWLLNVNFPRGKAGEWKRPLLTRPGGRGFELRYERASETPGQLVVKARISLADGEAPEGSDAWAFARGHVSVSPLSVVGVDGEVEKRLKTWDILR